MSALNDPRINASFKVTNTLYKTMTTENCSNLLFRSVSPIKCLMMYNYTSSKQVFEDWQQIYYKHYHL